MVVDRVDVLRRLEGGDRRSIGRVEQVVADVLDDPALFDDLFQGMLDDEPIIRMRSADAVEKITAVHPEYLQPSKEVLLQRVARSEQQEVRWHVAQMVSRLDLNAQERRAMVSILRGYLEDRSKIVKTCAMQALADLTEADPDLRAQVIPLLEDLTETGSPSMVSRGRKLLKKLMSPVPGS
jgi:hypothetical protein